jgi:hypothetical protein
MNLGRPSESRVSCIGSSYYVGADHIRVGLATFHCHPRGPLPRAVVLGQEASSSRLCSPLIHLWPVLLGQTMWQPTNAGGRHADGHKDDQPPLSGSGIACDGLWLRQPF